MICRHSMFDYDHMFLQKASSFVCRTRVMRTVSPEMRIETIMIILTVTWAPNCNITNKILVHSGQIVDNQEKILYTSNNKKCS